MQRNLLNSYKLRVSALIFYAQSCEAEREHSPELARNDMHD